MPIPLACSVSVEKSAANLIGFPLYVTSCFSLAAFKILSLGITGTTIKDTWTKSRVRVEVGEGGGFGWGGVESGGMEKKCRQL